MRKSNWAAKLSDVVNSAVAAAHDANAPERALAPDPPFSDRRPLVSMWALRDAVCDNGVLVSGRGTGEVHRVTEIHRTRLEPPDGKLGAAFFLTAVVPQNGSAAFIDAGSDLLVFPGSVPGLSGQDLEDYLFVECVRHLIVKLKQVTVHRSDVQLRPFAEPCHDVGSRCWQKRNWLLHELAVAAAAAAVTFLPDDRQNQQIGRLLDVLGDPLVPHQVRTIRQVLDQDYTYEEEPDAVPGQ